MALLSLKQAWKQALKTGLIRKIQPSRVNAMQLLQMAEIRKEFLDQAIDEKFVALKVEAFYDIIKELLKAHMYKKGYSCEYDNALLVYGQHHFHDFGSRTRKINELFEVKKKLHATDFRTLKKYLEKNEDELKDIIALLKERLQ